MKSKVTIACGVLAMIAIWWLWPRPQSLSESEYDLAIALYRVCNQSSEEGLARIETLMNDSPPSETGSAESPLTSIITEAKAGQWRSATIACRRLLDEQVK